MADTQQTEVAAAAAPGLGAEDLVFLLLLVLALAAVALSGRLAYEQGARLETAKSHAQVFVRWAEAVAQSAEKEGLTLQRCASLSAAPAGQAPEAKPPSWSACRQALMSAGAPLAELANPFMASNALIGSKCERKLPASRGLVIVEKGTPTPPGLPPGVVWSALAEDEPMARGLQLRVQVCDGGGYPIRIAEVTL